MGCENNMAHRKTKEDSLPPSGKRYDILMKDIVVLLKMYQDSIRCCGGYLCQYLCLRNDNGRVRQAKNGNTSNKNDDYIPGAHICTRGQNLRQKKQWRLRVTE